MTFGDAIVTLKADLRHAISQSVAKFKTDTGMTPALIEIQIVETTEFGDRMKQYAVGDVHVGFGEY